MKRYNKDHAWNVQIHISKRKGTPESHEVCRECLGLIPNHDILCSQWKLLNPKVVVSGA